jgi:hypothetical protein
LCDANAKLIPAISDNNTLSTKYISHLVDELQILGIVSVKFMLARYGFLPNRLIFAPAPGDATYLGWINKALDFIKPPTANTVSI